LTFRDGAITTQSQRESYPMATRKLSNGNAKAIQSRDDYYLKLAPQHISGIAKRAFSCKNRTSTTGPKAISPSESSMKPHFHNISDKKML
jgi:regulation of enolase protein 1 (concanavalin A-like superfamily)